MSPEVYPKTDMDTDTVISEVLGRTGRIAQGASLVVGICRCPCACALDHSRTQHTRKGWRRASLNARKDEDLYSIDHRTHARAHVCVCVCVRVRVRVIGRSLLDGV